MWKKEFYRGTEKREHVDKMKKDDLRFELEALREEYDVLMLKQELHRMIDRIDLASDLREVRDYTEKAYKRFTGKWKNLYGCRDDIVAMTDNLASKLHADKLAYFSHFMYASLLHDGNEGDEKCLEALQGLPYISDVMKRDHYEYSQAKLEDRNC